MISVIIATKNGERYIARAIQSALRQSVALENARDASKHAGFEVVVVSDGSTDRTADIVRENARNDHRVRLIELVENVGPGRARNIAISGDASRGIDPIKNEFAAILDDDDIWQNADKLKNQIYFLEEHPNVVLVGAEKTEFTRENGEHLRWIVNQTDPEKIRMNMLSYNPIITSSAAFRRDAFEACGGFKDMRLAEDYDLWLRMGKIGYISNVPNAETTYTMRDGGASKSNRVRMARVVLSLAFEYRDSYPNWLKAAAKGAARLAIAIWKSILQKYF